MRNAFVILSATLALLTVPVPSQARGETIRIVIRGEALRAPIELTDVAITDRFKVGSGPGTNRVSREPSLIVDWARGVVEVPKGLRVYEVSFVTTRRDVGTYIVFYGIDPRTRHSYVHIPGERDPQYRDNTFLIYRGVEGHWFHAWSVWEEIANPLIAKALAGR